jgi:hypothetical protein
VHDSTAVGHFVLIWVLAVVVVVDRVNDAQIEQQPVENREQSFVSVDGAGRLAVLSSRGIGVARGLTQQLLLFGRSLFNQVVGDVFHHGVLGHQAKTLRIAKFISPDI